MSTVRTNNVQVGQSLTATNNFTLYQPTVPDGTVRLGVGNTGATTLDAVTVNSVGNVTAAGSVSGTTGSFSGNFSFNSGYGSAAVAYGCRAWVNFNGTGTVAIRASGNVSSITDNGTGDYTVNFTTAMPDANYSVAGSTTWSSPGWGSGFALDSNLMTTSTVRFRAKDLGATGFGTVDVLISTVAIFR